MIEFWAVLGLAITDHIFREKLYRNRDSRKKLEKVVKDECFRLSRYELGEVQRVISTEGVIERMREIHDRIWYSDDPCWFAKLFVPEYVHPYFIFNSERKEFEIPPGNSLNLEKKTIEVSPGAEFNEATREFELSGGKRSYVKSAIGKPTKKPSGKQGHKK